MRATRHSRESDSTPGHKGSKTRSFAERLLSPAPLRLGALALIPIVIFRVAALSAADAPNIATNSTPAYRAQRSFAQPVRPDPVGTNTTKDRAFWGAPPPMPHGFMGERDGKLCLSCHARETRIEKRQQAIVPVPHAEFSQCQQCHVNGTDKTFAAFRASLFIGLDFPGKGTRAHAFAPPTIPHKTFMRDNCLSCHGPSGKQKIASPHPFRSQCQQCHVPDASKNYDRPLPWKELDGEL